MPAEMDGIGFPCLKFPGSLLKCRQDSPGNLLKLRWLEPEHR